MSGSIRGILFEHTECFIQGEKGMRGIKGETGASGPEGSQVYPFIEACMNDYKLLFLNVCIGTKRRKCTYIFVG